MVSETNITPISIVFGTDKNYVFPVFVVIRSILLNSHGEYRFYIVSFDDIEKEVDAFDGYLKNEFTNYSVKIIKATNEDIKNAKIRNQHISAASYIRLLIPTLLPDHDKCLYLDADLLVCKDIWDLYQIDISDYYIAGVRDYHIVRNNKEEHRELLGLSSIENYVNAGVLLMNLKRIRDERVDERWIDGIILHNLYEDQDIINRACYGNTLVIDSRYNTFHYYINESDENRAILYLEDFDVQLRLEDIYIIHMGGPYKPWNSKRFKMADQWWKIAEGYAGNDQYAIAEANTDSTHKYMFDACDMIDVAKKMQQYNLVVWGAGWNGYAVADCLLANGIEEFVFVDSDMKKVGSSYRDIEVCSFDEIKNKDNCVWLVSCKNACNEVIKFLRGEGISNERIVKASNATNKEKMYYQAISRSYYDKEISDVAITLGVSLEEARILLLSDDEAIKKKMRRFFADEWIGLL